MSFLQVFTEAYHLEHEEKIKELEETVKQMSQSLDRMQSKITQLESENKVLKSSKIVVAPISTSGSTTTQAGGQGRFSITRS